MEILALLNQLSTLKIIDINSADINGNTPLHLASFNPDPSIASFLIRSGASVS